MTRFQKVECELEGSAPLRLTLSGSCQPVAPLKETIHFTAFVRQRESKGIPLANRTNQIWQLRPVIEGAYWSGAESFVVEPQQTRAYEIAYRPLTMTLDGKKHQVIHYYTRDYILRH